MFLLKAGRFTLLLCLLITAFSPVKTHAQVGTPFNQRDDEYRLLGLKRAKEAYDVARQEYDRKKEMFDKKIVSQLELEQARNSFANAEVNYQQSLLAVIFEKQFVSVKNAVKYQSEDGRKHVKLVLENASGGSPEFLKLVNIDEELFKTLQPDVINDVYVSLLNDENAIISQPYEAKIEELHHGQPFEIDFELLQDLDAVTVDLVYGNGSQRSPKIYLQKDSSANKVIIQSEQFAQEVELGGTASFDLTLELFSGTTNTFKLAAVNLPAQITRFFSDPGSQARLSQFKFTESTNTRRAALEVFLPDRPTEDVVIGRPIRFYVLVIPREQNVMPEDLTERFWSQEEIEALKIGYVRLEIVPSGVGRLLVRVPQLYHSIDKESSAEFAVEIMNEGTRRLDNVVVDADLPLNWEKDIDPPVISSLDIGEEKKVLIKLNTPSSVSVGRYEIRIRTSSLSDNQPVTGEDKTVTIEIKAQTNVVGIATIVLLIVGLVTGIVVFGIRLARR